MNDHIKKIFEQKQGSVLVVDQSSNVCQILSSELKEIGFSNIRTVNNVKSAMELFETEDIDWWITPLMIDDEVNAFHMLSFFIEVPALKKIRTTVMVNNAEKNFLSSVFDFGALSYMISPVTQESAKKDLNTLIDTFKMYDYNDCLVAAEYYRQSLKESQDFKKLLTLEEGLLELYADNPRVLMHYGNAKLLNGDVEEAKAVLYQSKLLDDTLAVPIDDLLREHKLNPEDLSTDYNFLGINRCVIIDSDEAQANVTQNYLQSIGVTDIKVFFDGQSAYEALSANPEPDLIIMEWRLPQLNSPALIQRLRSIGFWSVPIIIQSALVDSSATGFMKEMGIAASVAKPVVKEYFLKELIKVIQQDRRPTEIRAIEAKIRQFFSKGQISDAEALIPTYLSHPKVSFGNKLQIQAEVAYAKKAYTQAKALVLEALKFKGDSLFVLNLLGKILMKLGEFDLALKCLDKAQALAPQNVERLCQISDAHLELGDQKAADEMLEKAKTIDDENVNVIETEAKHEMMKGNVEEAKEILKTLSSLTSIISYMNNRAIIYARNSQFQESIDLYQKALASLPEDKAEERAAITYNLALAYVREGSDKGFKNAIKYLDEVNMFVIPRLNAKAQSLKARLEHALKHNLPFKLKERQYESSLSEQKINDKSEKTEEENSQNAASAQSFQQVDLTQNEENIEKLIDKQLIEDKVVGSIKKGEMCCYLITGSLDISPEVKSLLQNKPKFNFREAIKRGITLGADKVLASQNKN